jgi:hypothetical protein
MICFALFGDRYEMSWQMMAANGWMWVGGWVGVGVGRKEGRRKKRSKSGEGGRKEDAIG